MGRTTEADFASAPDQLALLGCGGWPACLGGETELMRLGCGEGLDGRRFGRLGHLGRLAHRQSWR